MSRTRPLAACCCSKKPKWSKRSWKSCSAYVGSRPGSNRISDRRRHWMWSSSPFRPSSSSRSARCSHPQKSCSSWSSASCHRESIHASSALSSAVQTGGPDLVFVALGRIADWIEANGCQIVGPYREVGVELSLDGPFDDMIVEVHMPVERRSASPTIHHPFPEYIERQAKGASHASSLEKPADNQRH